jgi:hypothetical protein
MNVIVGRPNKMTVMEAVNKVSRHITRGMARACSINYSHVSKSNQTRWEREPGNPYNPTCSDRKAIPGLPQGHVMNVLSYFDVYTSIYFARFTAVLGHLGLRVLGNAVLSATHH